MAAVVRSISQENNNYNNNTAGGGGGDGLAEDEPLLGRIGDASQPEEDGIWNNLVLGTFFVCYTGAGCPRSSSSLPPKLGGRGGGRGGPG